MGVLDHVTKGKLSVPDCVVIYGVDGIGKTTFAAAAPDCIFLGPEKGTANQDVSRLPTVKSYNDVLINLQALQEDSHAYKSLAVDSLDWLEPLVWDKVCVDAGATNIEAAYGGYGKGYVAANKIWIDFMSRLTQLRDSKGMNIILIAHCQVKVFNDPQTNSTYDRYQLKLNDKASALFREYVDSVLFANWETYTKEEKGKKTKAMGDGTRLMYTERRPGYDAKSRYSLPPTLPLDWNAYVQAKSSGSPEKPEALVAQIHELIAQIADLVIRGKATERLEAAGNDITKLLVIRNRLRTLLNQ